MYRFAFLIVAVTLLTSSTAQADLIYNNVSFANWSGTDGGTSRTGDMTFGGNTVGTVQLEAVNATEGFSTTFNSPFTNDGTAEKSVSNLGVFLARATSPAGIDPESTIEFKFTVLTLEPNWGSGRYFALLPKFDIGRSHSRFILQ